MFILKVTNCRLKYLSCPSGGGDPGGGQYYHVGDISAPPSGLALHPLLRLQTLQREEEEEEEEGPRPARLLHILAEEQLPPLSSAVPRITPCKGNMEETLHDTLQCFSINQQTGSFSVAQLNRWD